MFNRLARHVSYAVGTPYACGTAFILILVWAVLGPFLHFSEAWQLTVNTATTIITFLMIFLMQNAQNNDTAALHAKLDELIRSSDALDEYIGIENKDEI